MLERVDPLIFLLNVSRLGGGMRSRSDILSPAPRLYGKSWRSNIQRRHFTAKSAAAIAGQPVHRTHKQFTRARIATEPRPSPFIFTRSVIARALAS